MAAIAAFVPLGEVLSTRALFLFIDQEDCRKSLKGESKSNMDWEGGEGIKKIRQEPSQTTVSVMLLAFFQMCDRFVFPPSPSSPSS